MQPMSSPRTEVLASSGPRADAHALFAPIAQCRMVSLLSAGTVPDDEAADWFDGLMAELDAGEAAGPGH